MRSLISKMSLDKMHDEKLEQRSGSEALEAGIAGEDGGLEKRVLLKMDVRYVSFPFLPIPCLLFEMESLCS
jgi:hypothetical protein